MACIVLFQFLLLFMSTTTGKFRLIEFLQNKFIYYKVIIQTGTYYGALLRNCIIFSFVVVVVDLPLLRVAVEGSDNPVSLEKPCQASLPPDQQGRHSLGRHPEVQYVA